VVNNCVILRDAKRRRRIHKKTSSREGAKPRRNDKPPFQSGALTIYWSCTVCGRRTAAAYRL